MGPTRSPVDGAEGLAEDDVMVTADMEILEIIHRLPETLTVFRRLEGEKGRCICCEGLFLTLAEAASTSGFDLEGTLADLREAAQGNVR